MIEKQGFGFQDTLQGAVEPQKVSDGSPAPWRPIETAPKDRTPIWGCLRDDISVFEGRPDLERWNGVQGAFRHRGPTGDKFDIGWSVAMPVAHGGFPDAWFAGWMPLPTPPRSIP